MYKSGKYMYILYMYMYIMYMYMWGGKIVSDS